MLALRSPLVRVAVTLALLGLLGVSVLLIKNSVTASWQGDRQEGALYKRSPGCFPRRDPSEVDAALPPCQAVTRTVTAKPQNTVADYRGGRNYPTTHRFLTLRDAGGQSQTVGDIYEDMWNTIHVGDQVSVTLWRGQVREVNANGYGSPIFDETEWNRTKASLWPWIVVALLCSTLLSLLWRRGRGRTDSGQFLV